jgi:hypothetical protein
VPLNELEQTAQKCVGEAPKKALTFLGFVLDAQRQVLEFQLALIEDSQQILRKFTAPPASKQSGS